MNGSLRLIVCSLVLLSAQLAAPPNSAAYSVFTHEELIDLAWNDSIRPILLARFPAATEHDLRVAHSFAYGGCAIQDMGYYPFGKEFFSNLTHYVRTGDFITWMFRNANSINELAFAIGALSHYLGDSIGHSEAINPATGIEFPKLARKYGPSVTYGETPHGHIRTEFAFDVGELTNAEFAPPAYLKYIGFRVPRKFLEQAFAATYGFQLPEVLGKAHAALRSYRTSVRSFIPTFAEGEVVLHRHHFPPQPDSDAYRQFSKRVARTSYERRWKHTYRGPGFKAHLVAILIFIVPKIGAASDLAIKIPSQDTQERYLRSVNHTVDQFHDEVQKLTSPDGASLTNLDLDTGHLVNRGDYQLADEAHDGLLRRLTSKPERVIPAALKRQMLAFYAKNSDDPDPPKEVEEALELFRRMKEK
jgi:Zinc dependent phospholipase C